MTRRRLIPLVAAALLGCSDASDEPRVRGSAELAKKKDEGKSAEPDEPPPRPVDARDADEAPPEEAGDEAVANPPGECPTELSGRENADRVITKACGVVTVSGNYAVDGATLTLEAGATLAFKDGAELSIGYYEPAKLVVKGTKDAPVIFTSGGDKAPGVWKGVRLYPKSSGSSIEGLVVEYAGDKKHAVLVEGQDVVFANSTIRHVHEPALEATVKGSFASFTKNAFEDVGAIAMRVPPEHIGAIGAGNTFDEKSSVHVAAGTVENQATWPALAVPYLVVGEVRVDGKEGAAAMLTIAEGARVSFDGDARMSVGYYAEGKLVAKGSSSKSIVFGSNRGTEPGSWRGLAIYGKGEAELKYVVFEHGGKREAEGVLLADNRSRVNVTFCAFTANKAGIVLRGAEVEAVAIDGNLFKDTPLAIRLPAHQVGALGNVNEYQGDPQVVIEGGTTGKDAKWVRQKGAKLQLDGNLAVDGGTLEIAAGFELAVADGIGIDVGYYEAAALKLMGTASDPIRFVGTRDEPGAWKSIVFHKNAHGNELHHVQLVNAGGEAGLVFKRDADGKVEGVACDKCSGPTLQTDPKAKVETR